MKIYRLVHSSGKLSIAIDAPLPLIGFIIFDFDEPTAGEITERSESSLEAKPGFGVRVAEIEITGDFTNRDALERLRDLKDAGRLGRAYSTAMTDPVSFWAWVCGRLLFPPLFISHIVDAPKRGSKLPTPTQEQINNVMATYGKYFRFTPSKNDKLKVLFAQAFLFRRPNGNQSIAIRQFIEIVNSVTITGPHQRVFSIGFGSGHNTKDNRAHYGGDINISIEWQGNAVGSFLSDEVMVVSIMHELLHAADLLNPELYARGHIKGPDRHNEIYRLQNQTLNDLGIPMDFGHRGGKKKPDGTFEPIDGYNKYIGSEW